MFIKNGDDPRAKILSVIKPKDLKQLHGLLKEDDEEVPSDEELLDEEIDFAIPPKAVKSN